MAYSQVFNPLGGDRAKGDFDLVTTNTNVGSATLVAGTVTVAYPTVTAASIILLTGQNSSGTAGELTISARVASTSFTITSSSGTDTRLIGYIVLEPVTAVVVANVGANAALTLLGP